MRWSYKVARIVGVDVFVHATFVLLLVWIAAAHWLASRSIEATVTGVLFILALFACVLLHELGHVVTAARFGVATRDIILLPIGGVARLERLPEKPLHELLVAVAGPAVNLIIAAALYAWLAFSGSAVVLGQVSMTGGSIAARLMIANAFILLFNLLPAFPMDGGRVLRALLAMRVSHVRATRIAVMVGQALALLFAVVGLFTNPFLVFIALFVWIGAAGELTMAQTRSALAQISLEEIVAGDVPVLSPGDSLERAVELTLTGAHKDFPVVYGETVVGILTQRTLLAALARPGDRPPVGALMDREPATVEIGASASEAFDRLQAATGRTLVVTREGRLVGVVTLDNVGQLLAIQRSLDAASRAAKV